MVYLLIGPQVPSRRQVSLINQVELNAGCPGNDPGILAVFQLSQHIILGDDHQH